MPLRNISGAAVISLRYDAEVDLLSEAATLPAGTYFLCRSDKWVYRKEASGQTPAFFGGTGNVDTSDFARLSQPNTFTQNQNYRKTVGQPVVMDFRHHAFTVPDYSASGYDPSLPTDIFARIAEATSAGGLQFDGFTTNQPSAIPFVLVGTHGSTAPVQPALFLVGRKHNGSGGFARLADGEEILRVSNHDRAHLRMFGNGQVYFYDSSGNVFFDLDPTGGPRFGRTVTIQQASGVPEIRMRQTGLTGIPSYPALGFSPALETGTFGMYGLNDSARGGLAISGYTDTSHTIQQALSFLAVAGNTPTREVMAFLAAKKNATGSDVVILGDDEEAFAFRTGSALETNTRYLSRIFGSGRWRHRVSGANAQTVPTGYVDVYYTEISGTYYMNHKLPNGNTITWALT